MHLDNVWSLHQLLELCYSETVQLSQLLLGHCYRVLPLGVGEESTELIECCHSNYCIQSAYHKLLNKLTEYELTVSIKKPCSANEKHSTPCRTAAIKTEHTVLLYNILYTPLPHHHLPPPLAVGTFSAGPVSY